MGPTVSCFWILILPLFCRIAKSLSQVPISSATSHKTLNLVSQPLHHQHYSLHQCVLVYLLTTWESSYQPSPNHSHPWSLPNVASPPYSAIWPCNRRPRRKTSSGHWLVASLKNFVQFGEFWWIWRISVNLVNLVNFVEYGWILLKLTVYDKLVTYKLSRSEDLIKIFEIMIKIYLHRFLPYSQISYNRIHKYHIRHPIFVETWHIRQDTIVFTKVVWQCSKRLYNFIHKDCIHHPILAESLLVHQDPIVFTNIVLIIQSLRTLTHLLGYHANIFRVVS